MTKDKQKIKVLITGADSKPGGVAGYVNTILLFSNYDKFEFHVTVSEKEILDDSLTKHHNVIIRHIFPARYSLWSLPLQAYQLRTLLKKMNIDVLHLHTARAGFLGVIAGMGLAIGIVYTGHSWRFEQKENLMQKTLFYLYERYICHRAHIVTFLTGRDKNLGIQRGLVPPHKAIVISTRIDSSNLQKIEAVEIALLRQRFGIPKDALVIGNTGYLSSRKDPITFVKAAARIIATVPNAFFLWIGDGDLKDTIKDLANKSGLGGRLIITGFVPSQQVPRILQAMDVFLFTSRIEGVPLSIIEAQAMQLPIVSTDYIGSGVEDLIIHGKTGFVFPPGDYEKAAHCVLEIIANKEHASLMIKQATKHFQEMRSLPEKMSREYEKTYEKSFLAFSR
jgi:glycosyltransferase involved in cell wall biosynthesis